MFVVSKLLSPGFLSGIQRAAQTVLGVYLKRTCSRDTSEPSALGVLDDCVLYKATHSIIHSLQNENGKCLEGSVWGGGNGQHSCNFLTPITSTVVGQSLRYAPSSSRL